MFYYFNEQQIRKAIIAFGALFSNIAIQRKSGDGNQAGPPFVVPIRYSPGGKDYIFYSEKLTMDTDDPKSTFARILPRMGFDLTGISLNPDWAKSGFNRYKFSKTINSTTIHGIYPEGLPVVLNFELLILAENATDAFTIFEQIVPFFRPTITINLKGDPFPCDFASHVTLTGISYEDTYEGEVSDRRLVTVMLSFDMTMNLFAGRPLAIADNNNNLCRYDIDWTDTTEPPIINEVNVDFHTNEITFMVDGNFVDKAASERLVVRALPRGVLDPDLSTGTESFIDTTPPEGTDDDPD